MLVGFLVKFGLVLVDIIFLNILNCELLNIILCWLILNFWYWLWDNFIIEGVIMLISGIL